MTSNAHPKLYPHPKYSTVGAVSGGEFMRIVTTKKIRCVLVITITDMILESKRV